MHAKFFEINVAEATKTPTHRYKMESSIDALNEEDLEDGEIYEDEEPSPELQEPKSTTAVPQKTKPVQEVIPVPKVLLATPLSEPLKPHRGLENNDKPQRDQKVPFFKGKRKHDDPEEDERWKRDGKKNRRSFEFEREIDSSRMKQDGEQQGGEDDEEMMFVRGASPHFPDEDRDRWDHDGEEDGRHDMSHRPLRGYRGRGGMVSRRGERQRGRCRGRVVLRVNKRKRDDPDMCVFFLQGKCHRGSECPFLHEILPPRKLELCKFYMKDCCAKKDKCLYMHSEFPCKYFHTGLKCYASKKCKFSHAPLTDTTRNVLAKHLDTAPKDILGDFTRRDRDQRDRMDMRNDSRDIRGDSRDMRNDSRDMRGEPRDMRGESRDIRGESRDMRGESRDMRGESRDVRCETRDMRGDTRDMRGDTRDMRGDTRDMRGDSRDMRGDTRDMRGDSREMRGDSRDMRGESRDTRGDSRDTRGDSRETRGDSRDTRGDSRDMRHDSRDTRDMRNDSRDTRDMRGDSREMRADTRDMRSDSRDMRASDHRDMRDDSRDMRGDTRHVRGDSRDIRETRGELMKSKQDKDRKIPSLFDIKVTIPDDIKNSDENQTPMPSPTQRSQDSARSSDRDNYSADLEREKNREKERDLDHDRLRHEKAERSKERKAKREKAREHRKERRERREKEKGKKRERNKDMISEKEEFDNSDPYQYSELISPTQSEENLRSSVETPNTIPLDKSSNGHEKKPASTEINGLFPQHLPKKQQELFLRIQQQQREAENSQASTNDDDEDDKAEEDNWYSSDEESTPATSLPSLLSSLAKQTTTTPKPVTPLLNILASASAAAKPLEVNSPAPPITPFIPSNLDLSNLSTVFEALTNLQKMNSAAKAVEQQETTTTLTSVVTLKPVDTSTELPTEALKSESTTGKPEPPRMRDPRLRSDCGFIETHRRSIEGPVDTDLRPQAVKVQPVSSTGDVDLRSLPFKPVQHSPANEIDASISSHNPIVWQLLPADVIKADYTSLQVQPKPGVIDPRLRRVLRPPTDEAGLPRDPRQRLLDEPARDPRPRQPLLATPIMPPCTPRYDEDHRPQFYCMDSDMRQFPPPTPRLEDDLYTPGPSRPMDPRQRGKLIEDPRRTPMFPSRPDDIDLRPQMAHRVPFVNFK